MRPNIYFSFPFFYYRSYYCDSFSPPPTNAQSLLIMFRVLFLLFHVLSFPVIYFSIFFLLLSKFSLRVQYTFFFLYYYYNEYGWFVILNTHLFFFLFIYIFFLILGVSINSRESGYGNIQVIIIKLFNVRQKQCL